MKVEVLYFRGCPNHQQAVENAIIAAREEGVTISLNEVEIHTPEEAQEMFFLGSPSVRVNGLDIEPAARKATGFGLGCRCYITQEGSSGPPSIGAIREALVEASERSN